MPPPGAPGAATGAIAIGTAATSTSITITISIVTKISTATSIAKAATGSTIRNTAGMHLTGTGKRRISSGVRALVAQAALVVPAVRVALVVSEDPAEPAVQVALVEWEDPVEPAVQESPAVQVALVEWEDPVEPAVQESPAVQVAPERELVQVEAVPAREHPRARPAVALRTRSVTAAHRPGLVRLLEAAEDLVAPVAETTRERAAAEVVIAWEVAE